MTKQDKRFIKSARLREKYAEIKHPSGLTLLLYPMQGYSSAYAVFATKYGSIDTTFKTKHDEDFVTVPEGIAHYLEHKLFENEDGNASDLFGQTGAMDNAFTSFDKTAYFFSCSQKFEENLAILLDFVQRPYFTDESVENERGIIGQEISMYDDEASWRVFFNNVQAIYHNNPARVDIAGTKESIAEIDKELLYRCHKTFYNLNNMVLSVAGNFDPKVVIRLCDKMLAPAEDIGLTTVIPDEPYEVKEKETVQKLECSMPLFQLGFKFPNFVGRENVLNYVHYNILLETVLGQTSELGNRLYRQQIISDHLSVGIMNGRGFFLAIAEGEAEDPRRAAEEIKKALKHAQKHGIPEDEFLNIKKKTYGELLKMFNSVDSVARNMMNMHFDECSLYDMIEMTAATTMKDMKSALKRMDVDNSSLSIIEPIRQGGETTT